MTQLKDPPLSPAAERQPSPAATSWRVNAFLVLAAGLLALGLVAGVVYWRFHQQHQQALADVEAEVERIRAAGQPITTEDFVALHRVPEGTADVTPLWLEAIALATQRKGSLAAQLPFVGQGKVDQLRPQGPDTLLPTAEAYLASYDDAIAATRRAAAAKGQCRYPIDFHQGMNAKLKHLDDARQLARLLFLRAHVAVFRGRDEEALESVQLTLSLARSMDHEPNMRSQLVRLPLLDLALAEAELLVGERTLADEQLHSLQEMLEAIPVQGPMKVGLIGERGVGFHAFHHGLGAAPAGAPARLDRPGDCLFYLQMMDQMLAVADKPATQSLQEMTIVNRQIAAKYSSGNPFTRSGGTLSAQVLPAINQFLTHAVRLEAERDAAVAGVAFRRFQLAHGRPPVSLAGMEPEFLLTVPQDPFQPGAPLKFIVKGNQFAIYSVGMNGTDDQALLGDRETQDDTGLAGTINLPAKGKSNSTKTAPE
jgi:hypothetical protein